MFVRSLEANNKRAKLSAVIAALSAPGPAPTVSAGISLARAFLFEASVQAGSSAVRRSFILQCEMQQEKLYSFQALESKYEFNQGAENRELLTKWYCLKQSHLLC